MFGLKGLSKTGEITDVAQEGREALIKDTEVQVQYIRTGLGSHITEQELKH